MSTEVIIVKGPFVGKIGNLRETRGEMAYVAVGLLVVVVPAVDTREISKSASRKMRERVLQKGSV